MSFLLPIRILSATALVTVLAACVGHYPAEMLKARAWVLQRAPGAGGGLEVDAGLKKRVKASDRDRARVSSEAPMMAEAAAAETTGEVKVLTVPTPLRDFPEREIAALHQREDLGLAFSGGGNRAAMCSLGQVRALREMGVMGKVRYISSVSGGSWFCVPYTFYNGDDDAFLGRYVPPGQLTWSEMQKEAPKGSFAWCGANADTHSLSTILSGHGDENFAHRINEIYLKPFGTLGDKHRFFCHDDITRDAILSRNPGLLKKEDFNVAAPGRPYLITNNVLVARGLSRTARFAPVEVTANYTGTAAYRTRGKLFSTAIGGGYVESFAYDSWFASATGGGKEWEAVVQIPRRRGLAWRASPRFSLSDMMASSGAAPSVPWIGLAYMLGFPDFYHWSPATLPVSRNAELVHTDGGAIDNAGVIPLLRRGVGTIVAFVNTEMKFDKQGSPVFPDYVGALFGKKQSGLFSQGVQVFKENEYEVLSEQFMRAWHTKSALIIHRQKTYRTVANTRYGIEGGHEVRMIWVFLGGAKEEAVASVDSGPAPFAGAERREGSLARWLHELPSDARAQFAGGKKSQFRNFPYYQTFGENPKELINLSHAQVQALSQYTCFTLREKWKVFQKWADQKWLEDAGR